MTLASRLPAARVNRHDARVDFRLSQTGMVQASYGTGAIGSEDRSGGFNPKPLIRTVRKVVHLLDIPPDGFGMQFTPFEKEMPPEGFGLVDTIRISHPARRIWP